MKKLLLLVTIQIFAFSCSNSQDLGYSEKLDSCFELNELILLDRACQAFELQLTNQYANLELNEAYLQYLKDLGDMKIHPSFFFTDESKAVLKDLKSSTLFDKIWINLNSIEPDPMIDELGIEDEIIPITGGETNQEDTQPDIEIYCMNPRAEYFKCVSVNMTNTDVIDYYAALEQAPDINPALKASALGYTLKAKDFENDILKLSIAIELFFEMALMFPES